MASSNVPYEPVENPALYPQNAAPFNVDDRPVSIAPSFPEGAAQPRFLGHDPSNAPSLRESVVSSTGYPGYHTLDATGSTAYFEPYADQPVHEDGSRVDLQQSAEKYPPTSSYRPTQGKSSRAKWIGLVVLAVIVIAIAAVVAVYFTVIKPKHDKDSGSSSSNNTSGGSHGGKTPSVLGVQIGKDGSTVVTETGSSFTYNNKFGGYWVTDPSNPFNDGAKAQSWTPALNETFKYGIDTVRGVNLGGWLNLEPFITPALYQKYQNASTPAIDEWTLHVNMAADTAGGGLEKMMEQHYSTFITEEDFAQIAGAGLNYVRIPIPYWCIEVMDGEPFLPKVAWKYFLKAIQWARKYGIRINLDLHAVSGSQNGYNHSGKHGQINFMNGVMGLANVQRTLDHIRIIAEFISQPQYSNVVTMFSILNEPILKTIGEDNMKSFYYQAYSVIRNITGIGEGKGALVGIHDAFNGISNWGGFMPGADRLVLDTHTYFCFGGVDRSPLASQRDKPCKAWGSNQNNSMSNFGMTVAGEFSLGFNDCGLFLNGVGSGTRWEGTFAGGDGGAGDCGEWDDWTKWDQGRKNDLKNFALSSMDALQNWFFWTWKIGNSTKGVVEAPLWSYQLGLQNGWMPLDPRASVGQCAGLGVSSPFNGPLKPSQTGGAGAGQVAPTFVAQYGNWPPANFANGGDASLLPTYTPTGTVSTLPAPTITAMTVAVVDTASSTSTVTVTVSGANSGNGWYKKDDTAQAYVPVAGCTYPDRWNALNAQVPPVCTGNGAAAPATATPTPAAPTGVTAPSKRMHVVAARVTPIA